MLLKNSIIISYSTPNYEPLTNLFFETLSNIGVNREQIIHKLDIPNNSLTFNTGFQTDLWYFCVKNKMKHLIDTLENHEKYKCDYFIYSDCDIWFIEKNKEQWKNLKSYVDENNKDIYFMSNTHDIHLHDVNTGFFIIKNNQNIKTILKFFKGVYENMMNIPNDHMALGDQTIININKWNINFGLIPNQYVVIGVYICDPTKSLFHHAVACRDVDDKLVQINQIKNVFA